MRLEVLNPQAQAIEQTVKAAARPNDLNGKRIGLYWNLKPGGDHALTRAAELLSQRLPGTTFTRCSGEVRSQFSMATAADVERIASACDAVIGTTSDWGSCTSWLVHDMVELEKAGVPTVSFTAEAFAVNARRSAQIFGLPELPIAVIPLPLTNQTQDEIRRTIDGCIDQVIKALTAAPTAAAEAPAAGAPAERVIVEGTDALDALDRMIRLFLERGWSDGFPLVAPTPDRVERMLRGTGRAPDQVVAVLEPGFGVATVEKIAINSVMAGCMPEHLPLLIAAVEAVSDPKFFLRVAAMSTGPHAPLMLVNGPIARELRINSGCCAIGPGSQNHANVVIGRALRLIYLNIGHAYPGVMDMDTIGSANKFSLCVAENEDANPWSPFHVERGYDRETSTVTVITVYAQSDVYDFFSTTPGGILDTVARAAANPAIASTGRWLEGSWADPKTKVKILDRNLLLLCPEHAALIAKQGWSKAAVRDYLYRHATLPFRVLCANREPSTLIAGRPDLQWLTKYPELELPIVELPECYELAVVGGAAGRSMYFYGAHEAITKRIERS